MRVACIPPGRLFLQEYASLHGLDFPASDLLCAPAMLPCHAQAITRHLCKLAGKLSPDCPFQAEGSVRLRRPGRAWLPRDHPQSTPGQIREKGLELCLGLLYSGSEKAAIQGWDMDLLQ